MISEIQWNTQLKRFKSKIMAAAAAPKDVDEKAPEKVFIAENMGDGVRNAKYAVRGAIVKRAYQVSTLLSAQLQTHLTDAESCVLLVFRSRPI